MEVEVADPAVDFAPHRQQDGRLDRDIGRHGPLDLEALEPAVGFVGHAVGNHGVVIGGQRVLAEPTPAAGILGIAGVEKEPSDDPIVRPDVANLGADHVDDPGRLMPQQQGIVLHAGEMPRDELPVGGVAQTGDLGLYADLVGARRRLGDLHDFDLARFDDGDGSHDRFLRKNSQAVFPPQHVSWANKVLIPDLIRPDESRKSCAGRRGPN